MALELRQEIQLEVTGADKTERAIKSVKAATDEAATSARNMGMAMDGSREAMIRQQMAASQADAAIRKWIEDEDKAAAAVEKVAAAAAEAEEPTSKFGVAGEMAGKAMSGLRKAAELIPGMELGTIFAMAASGAWALFEAVAASTGSLDLQAVSLDTTRLRLEAATKAEKELQDAVIGRINAQSAGGASGVLAASDLLGSGATPGALARVASLQAQKVEAERRRADYAAALGSMGATGRGMLGSTQEEMTRAEAERARLISAPAAPMGVTGAAGWKAINERLAAIAATDDKIRDLGQRTLGQDQATEGFNRETAALERLNKELEGYTKVGETASQTTGKLAENPFLGRAAMAEFVKGANGSSAGATPFQQMQIDAMRNAHSLPAWGPDVDDASRLAAEYGGMMGGGAASESLARSPEGAQVFADKMTDVWKTQIPDAVSFGASAIQQAAGVIGQSFTNLIIGGDKVKGGVGRMFGELAATLSTSMFTYATMALALGTAATIMGPASVIFGFTAPQAFGAAAAFGAGGVALAATARALGAGSSSRGASGGGGGASAAPRGSLAGPGMSGPQTINATINMDGEPVYSGLINVEQRRRSSGSLTAPMLGAT